MRFLSRKLLPGHASRPSLQGKVGSVTRVRPRECPVGMSAWPQRAREEHGKNHRFSSGIDALKSRQEDEPTRRLRVEKKNNGQNKNTNLWETCAVALRSCVAWMRSSKQCLRGLRRSELLVGGTLSGTVWAKSAGLDQRTGKCSATHVGDSRGLGACGRACVCGVSAAAGCDVLEKSTAFRVGDLD